MKIAEIINHLMELLIAEAVSLCGDEIADSDHVQNIIALNHAIDRFKPDVACLDSLPNLCDFSPFSNLKPGER